MEVNDVKEYLGKKVYYRISPNDIEHEYILNAYILRKKDNKLIKQVELQDNNSVLTAPLYEIRGTTYETKSDKI